MLTSLWSKLTKSKSVKSLSPETLETGMQYRRLGRTNFQVSTIGFGTCQLRMIPKELAVQSLLAGFKLGVNIVHTSADYAGAIEIVEEAVSLSKNKVYVCANGWGSVDYFEHLFEDARERFGRLNQSGIKQLDIFGIACPEDRDILGDDVWSDEGLIAFLRKKSRKESC